MQQPKEVMKKKLKLSIPVLSLVIIAGIVLLTLLGVLGVRYLVPKPLSLPAGKDLEAMLQITPTGPYHVGDLITATLEVKATKGITCRLPELTMESGALIIKEKGEIETENRPGGWVKTVPYLLTGWEAGTYSLPDLTVDYQTASGGKKSLRVPGVKITIASVLPKGKSKEELLALNPKDIKGPVGLPPRYQFLWWFLAGAALIGLVVLATLLIRKYWPKKAEAILEETTIVEPAHLIAFRRLEALQKAGYLDQGDFKTYYSELSEIIREYMENRFQVRALEMTTEEFLVYLTGNNCLERPHQLLLTEFLKSSDLVKFAKYLPLIQEADRAYGMSRRLVEETKEKVSKDETENG